MLLFRSLASGSSGNAFLLQTGHARLLFDAGLRLSTLRKALASEGLHPSDLSGILISHEHRDHCAAAADLVSEFNVPVWANAEVLQATGLAGMPHCFVLTVGCPAHFGDVEVVTFPVSHDAVRPVGFFIRAGDRTITIATDLGQGSSDLDDAVAQADLVVLEANHDLEMLHQGRYPQHLRRRVASSTGHLSNVQAATILARSLKRDDVDIWLAHLSKENNTQTLAQRTVQRTLKSAGFDKASVGIALRDKPSLRWLGMPRPRQLTLFDFPPTGI